MSANKSSQTTFSLEALQEIEEHHEDLHKHKIDRKFQGKESLITSQLSLYVEEMKPKIPDGGWGWFVVLAAFLINMVSEGVIFTFGLLYIEFLREFDASKSATSWIGSIFMAVPLLSGPIASAFVDKYGCKWMTVVGSIICAFGFVLSSYTRTIGVMYVTFGVIGGLGRGLSYVTAVVSIAFWFEKKRTFVLGLAASGAGIGTVVFSPLSTYLLSEFGWRGTVLIFAGFFANMCVCGVLMRNPDWIIIEEKRQKKLNSANIKELKQRKNSCGTELRQNRENERLVTNGESKDGQCVSRRKHSSVAHLPTFLKHNEKKWYEEYLDVVKELTHFSLFLELHFFLLALSTIILFIWFIVPYFYLAEHMTRVGYTETQASFVLSIIGFTNTVGMVFLGWAGDRLNVAKTYAICLILCGISVGAMMFFTHQYIPLVISSALFGLFFASCFSLTPSLLAQLVSLEDFTMAYGLVLLCDGIGNLTGPPLAGMLFDLTQSWDQSFYQAAIWIIISGILVGIIPYTKNRKFCGSRRSKIEEDLEKQSSCS